MRARRQLRSRRAPRVRPAAFRKAHAPHVLPFAARLEATIRAEFQLLIGRVLTGIVPILLARGARRDAVSLSELWQTLQTTQRPKAVLTKLFNQVNAETDRALAARLPGLPIAAVVRNGAQLEEQWIRKNTDLLVAGPRVQRAVEAVIAQPLDRGLSVREIQKQLETKLGVEARRAELIARDQTLKLAGQLQQARQTGAGIRRYVWTTSEDERVRPDHAKLDGTIQSWDAPPVVDQRTGRRAHPGGDFQCRCSPDPILDDPTFAEQAPSAEPILSDEPSAEALGLGVEEAVGAEFAPEGLGEEAAAAPDPFAERLQALEEERQAFSATEAQREEERAAAEQARLEADRQAAAQAAQQRTLEQARLEFQALLAQPSRAPAQAQTLLAQAAEATGGAAASAEILQAIATALPGKSLADLGAIPFTAAELQSDTSLRFLRGDPFFAAGGDVADNFGSSKGGLPQITIEADGRVFLSNGRHRLTVARELGLSQIKARVRKLGPRGGVRWEYVGLVKI